MKDLVLLGTGNVATHLFKAFMASEKVRVKQVFNHSISSLSFFAETVPVTSEISELAPADIYLLALKDDVIPEVAGKMKTADALVAHTSGAAPLDILKMFRRRGVFYPLQTFSKDSEIDPQQIPFCLEANSPKDLDLLKDLGNEISGKVFDVDSEQRKKLHLSAVFVCNFVNHLYTIGEKLCRENDLPFSILQPLIAETAKKVQFSSPAEVQTGPAIRKDSSTIQSHLKQLQSSEEKEIYQILTNAIQSFHGKKL